MMYHIFYTSNFDRNEQYALLDELNNRLLHTGQHVFFDYKNEFFHSLDALKTTLKSCNKPADSTVTLLNYSESDEVSHYIFDQYKLMSSLSFGLKGIKFNYVTTRKPSFYNKLTKKIFFKLLDMNCNLVICKNTELAEYFKANCSVNVRVISKRVVPLDKLDERRRADLGLSFLTNSYIFTAQASLSDPIELFEYIRLAKKLPNINLFIHLNHPRQKVKAFLNEVDLPENLSIVTRQEDFERYLLKSICYIDLSGIEQTQSEPRAILQPLLNGVPIIAVKNTPISELVMHQYNGMILPNHSLKGVKRVIDQLLENRIIFDYFQHNAIDRACHPLQYQLINKIEIFDRV